jgi:hypothetical protein
VTAGGASSPAPDSTEREVNRSVAKKKAAKKKK